MSNNPLQVVITLDKLQLLQKFNQVSQILTPFVCESSVIREQRNTCVEGPVVKSRGEWEGIPRIVV